MSFIHLSTEQKDVLQEIGNIGAGNAATSMSQLINKKINMEVPSVKIVSFDEMMEMIGGPEEVIVAILFRITGEMPGTVYFLSTVEEAKSLISQLTFNSDLSFTENGELNELALSALQEVGNILTGSYLTALSDFTNVTMQPSVPHLSIDMAGATLTAGLIELSQVTDYALVIDTQITDEVENENKGIHGQFLLLPDPESFSKLFTALGIDDYA
ncbi:chemotaxis protein CheC [Virgibacillus sp. W0430]|uniref:chemotaxis protein CheC n=1 Tax=Virgibacillus sp. W0430 TaxID=3391580 RepID=UPI003F4654CD